jgi:hypothetical protein
MQLNREQFLNTLQYCAPGLAKKEISEQSRCFVFLDGNIFTYDDECACRIPSPLGTSLESAVPNERLLVNLQKLPDETIDVTVKGGELVIKGKNKETLLRMEQVVDTMRSALGSVQRSEDWHPLPESFGDAVGLVQQAAGFDDNKFSLTCIHVTPNYIEACDYFKICRWSLQTGFTSDVLMRRSAIKNVTGMGAIEFSETSNWVHFRNARGLVLSCRRYTDVSDYPNLDKNMQLAGEALSLPLSLGEVIDRAKDFLAPKGDNHDQIKVDLRPGMLRITGSDGRDLYREKKKVEYTGQPLSFMLPPDVLTEIVKKHGKCCEVTNQHLIVKGTSYRFITGLSRDSDGEEKKEEGTNGEIDE